MALLSLGSACGGHVESSEDRPGFDLDLCSGTGRYQPLDDLRPAQSVDYLTLRTQYDDSSRVDASSLNITTTATWGEPCVGAVTATCASQLKAVRSDRGWDERKESDSVTSRRYLVFTRADHVEVVASVDDLRQFLGPIDSAHEAALIAATQQGYWYSCGKRARARSEGGFELIANTGGTCGRTHLDEHRLVISVDGTVAELESKRVAEGDPACAVGRRPRGLVPAGDGASNDELALFFGKIAHLEAASIPAFEMLARELVEHGAPPALVDAANAAREDEMRHAQATRALAERFGGVVDAPSIDDVPGRDRLAFAIENAIEGCVRETFGAVVAAMQAKTSCDPDIAGTFAVIADDEARHASLAWEIAAWMHPRLDSDERATLQREVRAAVSALEASLEAVTSDRLREVAGWPSPTELQRAFRTLDATLWAGA